MANTPRRENGYPRVDACTSRTNGFLRSDALLGPFSALLPGGKEMAGITRIADPGCVGPTSDSHRTVMMIRQFRMLRQKNTFRTSPIRASPGNAKDGLRLLGIFRPEFDFWTARHSDLK